MGPLNKPVLLSGAASFLAALLTSAAPTNDPAFRESLPNFPGSTNLFASPAKPGAAVNLDWHRTLKPDVYQTRHYAMIVVVPETGLDDRCVVGRGGAISKMPVINPNLQTVPKTDSKRPAPQD